MAGRIATSATCGRDSRLAGVDDGRAGHGARNRLAAMSRSDRTALELPATHGERARPHARARTRCRPAARQDHRLAGPQRHRQEFAAARACGAAGRRLRRAPCSRARALLAQWPRREFALRVALLPQASDDPFPGSVLESALVGRHPHIDFWQWESEADRAIARAVPRGDGPRRARPTATSRRCPAASGAGSASPRCWRRRRASSCSTSRSSNSTRCTSSSVLRLFRARADAGACVVMSLHDPGLAARFRRRGTAAVRRRTLVARARGGNTRLGVGRRAVWGCRA